MVKMSRIYRILAGAFATAGTIDLFRDNISTSLIWYSVALCCGVVAYYKERSDKIKSLPSSYPGN